MRPHRLAFSALGPYPGDVKIDFDQLVADGLFLIWGPTGAGKTFLLDALCFALYGEVPGERRHDTLRSDHAAPDASPQVELEFTADNARWRVSRSPWHERAKKTGEGTTEVRPKAALERLEGDGWHPVAQKLAEVHSEVTRLLGLTASQFQQVVLLPQGRFEKVLRSKSEDREKLLRTLFDTSIYATAAAWLDDEAKQHREKAASLEQQLLDLRTRAADRWREVRPASEDSDPLATPATAADATDQQASVTAGRDAEPQPASRTDIDAPDSDAEETARPWPGDQADFDALDARSFSEAERAYRANDAAAQHLESVRRECTGAKQTAELWDRRKALRRRRDELAANTMHIEASRETLRLAGAAEQARQSLDAQQRSQERLDANVREVSGRYAALQANWADALSLPDGLAIPPADDRAMQDRLAEIKTALALHRDRLEAFVKDAEAAAGQTSEATALKQAADEQIRIRDERDGDAAEHERLCDEATERLRGAESAAKQVSAFEDAAQRAQDRAEAATDLQSLYPQQEAANDALGRATETSQACREAWLELRERYLDGIAAELAGQLKDGQPCSVCGSRHHPDPTQPADDSVRTDEVEEAEADVDSADKDVDAAREALHRINSRIARLRGRAGDAADDPDAAAERATELAETAQAAAKLAEKTDELRDAVDHHRNAASADRTAARQAERAASAAVERARAAADKATDLRQRIETEIGDIDPAAALASLATVEADLGGLTAVAADRAQARTELETVTRTLAEQLGTSPFTTAEQARSALRGNAERNELQSAVTKHDQEQHDVERDLDTEEMRCLPDERPDTEAAQMAVDDAEQRANEARDRRTRAVDAHDAISGWAAEHRGATTRHSNALAEAEHWTAVADRCNGRLQPKVSLQRWVLSAYLEKICEFANRRLSSMTSGRYRLSVYRESERHGTQAGLGLRVHDTFTGAEREVSTLSGGETFQASLSLALGVADVVTQRRGGVYLEVLFVDEGFGTLDSEALQLAMDQLDRLRKGGRSVGLISHVSELRERIRTGIQVRPTDKGSTISVGAIADH